MTPRECITDGCPGWPRPGEIACFACDVEARGGPAPFYSRGPVTLYRGNAREVSPWWISSGVVIFDPPYSRHTHGKSRRGNTMPMGNGVECYGRENDLGFAHLSADDRRYFASESVRLAERWALVFSDVESAFLWRASMQAAGDAVLEAEIVRLELEALPPIKRVPGLEYIREGYWRKLGGTPQFTGDRPGIPSEAITICHPKGRKTWNGGGTAAIWDEDIGLSDPLWFDVPIVSDRGATSAEPRLHTTQKPEALMLDLVEKFSDPEREIEGKLVAADVVYDFTAGSCTTGIACLRANDGPRYFVGCELDPEVEIDTCATCGKGRHPKQKDHEWSGARAHVWADRARARLDAELSGSTYHAARAGQLSILDYAGGGRR